MATRNILNSVGTVIGELTLPDSTTEDQWTQSLASYALASVPAPVNSASLTTSTVTASGATTTSSSTASVIGGMTQTPPVGKYIAQFNAGIYTAGASATGEFGIYVNSVLIPESRRDISCNLTLLGGLVTISLNSIGVGTYSGVEVNLNGTETIDVRFKSTNGGTIGFNERVFTLIKVN